MSLAAPAPGEGEPPAQQRKRDDGWKVRASFGFSRTHYGHSDVSIRSPLMNIDIKDMAWKERTSAGFYNPANWQQPMDAFRWIDEPTNTFTLSATKNRNEFILSSFHPKYLLQPGQKAEVHGDVGGVRVDGVQYLHEPFDGYNRQPGELHISDIRNTHMNMEFQLGYGREIPIFTTRNNSSLVYRPAVYAGAMMGKTVSVYESEYWNHTGFEDKVRLHGPTVSLGNKLEFRYRDRVSAFVEHKITGAMMNEKAFGGTMTYNLLYSPVTFGVGFKLWDQKNHRQAPPPADAGS